MEEEEVSLDSAKEAEMFRGLGLQGQSDGSSKREIFFEDSYAPKREREQERLSLKGGFKFAALLRQGSSPSSTASEVQREMETGMHLHPPQEHQKIGG